MSNCKASMRHNAVVDGAMDVQATMHYRIVEDVAEVQMLRRLADATEHVPGPTGERLQRYASWLIEHDRRENDDHATALMAAKTICGLLELGMPVAEPTASDLRLTSVVMLDTPAPKTRERRRVVTASAQGEK